MKASGLSIFDIGFGVWDGGFRLEDIEFGIRVPNIAKRV